jgi:hypothetical protein
MYKYYLVVSFCGGNFYEIEEEVEKILGHAPGSGYGFGCRDLSYYFNHLSSLKAAVRKVRRWPRKIKCEAWENIDDYEQKKISLKGVK